MNLRSLIKKMHPYLFHVPLMLTCQEVEGFLSDYYEGRLTKFERKKFEFHIMMCRECREFMTAYRNSIALGKSLFEVPDAPVSADVPEDLVQAILAARTDENEP